MELGEHQFLVISRKIEMRTRHISNAYAIAISLAIFSCKVKVKVVPLPMVARGEIVVKRPTRTM